MIYSNTISDCFGLKLDKRSLSNFSNFAKSSVEELTWYKKFISLFCETTLFNSKVAKNSQNKTFFISHFIVDDDFHWSKTTEMWLEKIATNFSQSDNLLSNMSYVCYKYNTQFTRLFPWWYKWNETVQKTCDFIDNF